MSQTSAFDVIAFMRVVYAVSDSMSCSLAHACFQLRIGMVTHSQNRISVFSVFNKLEKSPLSLG
jgi:hypothetical protein